MGLFFSILFGLSFVALGLGLVWPRLVIHWGTRRNRWQVALVYGISAIVSFALIDWLGGAAAPPGAQVQKKTAVVNNTTDNAANETGNLTAIDNTTLPPTDAAHCRVNPLAGVYHPQRLKVETPCKSISGTVESVTEATDKDYVIALKPDVQFADLLNARNRSDAHGNILVHIIPMDFDKCPTPGVGEHITVTGAYVLDTDHGWMAIYPAWLIDGLGSAKYTSTEAAASVQDSLSALYAAAHPPASRNTTGNGTGSNIGNTAGNETGSGTDNSTGNQTGVGNNTGSGQVAAPTIVAADLTVSPGGTASITIRTTPGATGTIAAPYASGLGPQVANTSGDITWTWKVSASAPAGHYTVTVSVGGQSIHPTLTVK